MEQAVKVKRQPVWGNSFEKWYNFICNKISDHMEPTQPAFTIPSQNNSKNILD